MLLPPLPHLPLSWSLMPPMLLATTPLDTWLPLELVLLLPQLPPLTLVLVTMLSSVIWARPFALPSAAPRVPSASSVRFSLLTPLSALLAFSVPPLPLMPTPTTSPSTFPLSSMVCALSLPRDLLSTPSKARCKVFCCVVYCVTCKNKLYYNVAYTYRITYRTHKKCKIIV
jgi:hypothetical protein